MSSEAGVCDAAQRFKELKEGVFSRSLEVPGEDDLTPIIEFYREGVMLAALHVRGDRDEALRAMAVGVVGYRADEVVMMMDAHMVKDPSPELREAWRPGILQEMCHEDGACLRDEITDCLVTHRSARGGSFELVNSTYKLLPPDSGEEVPDDAPRALNGWRLRWTEETRLDGEDLAGVVVEALRKVWEAGDPISVLAEMTGEEPPPEARRECDEVTSERLAELGSLLAAESVLSRDLLVVQNLKQAIADLVESGQDPRTGVALDLGDGVSAVAIPAGALSEFFEGGVPSLEGLLGEEAAVVRTRVSPSAGTVEVLGGSRPSRTCSVCGGGMPLSEFGMPSEVDMGRHGVCSESSVVEQA